MNDFLPIPGFPKHEINRAGVVRAIKNGRIMTRQRNTSGNAMIKLPSDRGIDTTCMIARSVWRAFNGPLSPYEFIQYVDENRNNCHLDNLRITSMKEIKTGWSQRRKPKP